MCSPLLLAVALFLLLVTAAARSLTARALGMRGITFPVGGSIENDAAAAPWRRAVIVLAGILASYLVPVLFFVASLLLGGTTVFTSTEVEVIAGRPAAQAGMASGDRVLRVGGEPVATFQDLSRAIGARAGQPTEITVARGAEELRFTVLPEGPPDHGKIGVAAKPQRIPMSLGAALTSGVALPPKMILGTLEGLVASLSGRLEEDLAGPVGIVRETAGAARSGLAGLLYLCGGMLSYVWPAAVIAAIVTVPRRRRSRAL